MMKKKLWVLIAVAVLVIGMSIISVSAADPVATTNSVSAKRGETVTFTVTLTESVTVRSGGVALQYDNSVLSFVSGTCEVANADLKTFLAAKEKGTFGFNTATAVSGTLFTATFRILDTAAFGESSVTLELSLKDANDAAMTVQNTAGSVTVVCNHSYTKQDTAADYLKSDATCTSPAIYYYSCTSCGSKGSETFASGAAIAHSYTKEDASSTYLKLASTCTSRAVYYKSCLGCGVASTSETFEGGTVLPHAYTRQDTSEAYCKSAANCTSAAIYYYRCATCDEKGDSTYTFGTALNHTGGEATCTAQAVCTRCNQPYGEKLEHTYDQAVTNGEYQKSPATCTAKALYYKSCVCGAKGSVTFESGEKLSHDFSKETAADVYLKSAATCTAKAVYYKNCTVCGEKGTETFEYGETPSHSYKSSWSSDATNHWYECSKCGDQKDSTAHTPSTEATETTAQTCTVCGYVIKAALGHTHNYESEWSRNSQSHWHTCRGCSIPKDLADHAYDNACDTDCNVCGYKRTIVHNYKTEWMNGTANHWHECAVCGLKTDEAVHTPGADATETTAQICTVCGYVIKAALGHTHLYGTEWEKDEEHHWHVCVCGDKTDSAVHIWNEGTVTVEPTVDTEGVKTYLCTVCGQEKTEILDTTDTSEESTAESKEESSEESKQISDMTTEVPDSGCGSVISTYAGLAVLIAPFFMTIVMKKKESEE